MSRIIVLVSLHGCDDTTELNLAVTDEQLEFLRFLEQLSREESETSCMPTLSVRLA